MLNNIKVSHTTDEIVLSVNVIADIHEVIEELMLKLPKLKEFYDTSKLPFKVVGKLFTESEIEIIKKTVNEYISGAEIKFDDISDLLGLHTIKKTFETNTDISETKFVQNSIRSGQKEEYAGSIVICGDVNPGAEVIAGGNIMVLGTLRGVAHAGANGNKKAIISANCIEVTQVRIANLVKEVAEKMEKCPICYIEMNDIIIK